MRGAGRTCVMTSSTSFGSTPVSSTSASSSSSMAAGAAAAWGTRGTLHIRAEQAEQRPVAGLRICAACVIDGHQGVNSAA